MLSSFPALPVTFCARPISATIAFASPISPFLLFQDAGHSKVMYGVVDQQPHPIAAMKPQCLPYPNRIFGGELPGRFRRSSALSLPFSAMADQIHADEWQCLSFAIYGSKIFDARRKVESIWQLYKLTQ